MAMERITLELHPSVVRKLHAYLDAHYEYMFGNRWALDVLQEIEEVMPEVREVHTRDD